MVQPSTNTATVSSNDRSASSSRPTLHSTVARRVCWRSGMSTVPVPRASSDLASRPSSASGPSSRVRAAASSIASGRPSSRRQISATAAALAGGEGEAVARRAGPVHEQRHRRRRRQLRRPAPWRGRAGSGSGGTGYSRSARSRSTVRLVARIATPGQRANSSSRSRAASTTCSRLSRMSSHRSSPRCSTRACSGESVPARSAPTARAMPASTCSGSVTAASGTNTVPASKRSRNRSPTANANRVLPIPPGPVSVTRRTSGRPTQPGHLVDGLLPPEQRRRVHRQRATACGPGSAAAAAAGAGGGEPLAQQRGQVVAHQPTQLAGVRKVR